ncbi:MAG TPA: S8 family serine peptidase [Xanthobacteraceae bacterium]|nr:S8 family serine peptidase [Xanthobacteraceae bacterium]
MGFRAAFTSAVRAIARPHLVLPAAFVAVIALLSPPAVEDASAQGFRMQGSRGSFSSTGPGRFQSSMNPGMASKSAILQSGKSGRRPGTNNIVTNLGQGGMGGGGMGKGGMAGTGGGMGGRHPPTTVADPRNPKGGDHRPPGRPRFPIPPILPPGGDTVVTLPGGPASGPPSSGGGGGGGGGGQSTPSAQSNQPPTNWGRYVPNEVVVEVAATVSPETMNALLRRHRLTQLETVNLQSSNTSIRRLRINDRRGVPAVVRALAAEGFTVQPNLIATLQEGAAAMSEALEQYALARMRMPEAHTLSTGQRVLIAVIDSGADAEHPELAGMILDTFDAIGSGERTHAHGTSIVGAIAARSRLRGTAPGAHILVARAFGTQRSSMDGTSTDIIKALEWSMTRGARVINMSFAGSRDPGIERRLATARERGIILVAAAGNAGPTSAPLYPAANPVVIAVTATDIDDRIYRMANRGNHVAIAAPGVDLWLPTVDGGYRRTSGTSFSAAEITGVIALMLERNPGLTPDAVRRALLSTARDLGAPGLDPLFGAGLVDAYQAVSSVLPPALEANEAPATAGVGPGIVDN